MLGEGATVVLALNLRLRANIKRHSPGICMGDIHRMLVLLYAKVSEAA